MPHPLADLPVAELQAFLDYLDQMNLSDHLKDTAALPDLLTHWQLHRPYRDTVTDRPQPSVADSDENPA